MVVVEVVGEVVVVVEVVVVAEEVGEVVVVVEVVGVVDVVVVKVDKSARKQ